MMARQWQQKFQMVDGRFVGYSLTRRGDVYVVQFEGPNGDYRRVSTGFTDLNRAVTEAARIINRAYGFGGKQKNVTWDEVDLKLLTALVRNNNRQRTYDDYASSLRVLRATVDTDGPADVDERKAKDFADKFIGGAFTRGKAKVKNGKVIAAKTYGREHTTLNAHVRKLRSIWSKWLCKAFGLTTTNPWKAVGMARTDAKSPHLPDEDVVNDFMKWIADRYPGWDLPTVLIQTKAVLGCRAADICGLTSDRLQGEYIVMGPMDLKARNHRKIKLPSELAVKLHAVKGEIYLWEKYNAELRDHLRTHKKRTDKIKGEFTTGTVFWFLQRLFRKYNKTHSHRITSHDFRRRAVTLSFEAGYDVDTTARMFGLEPQTVRLYYLAWNKLNTDTEFTVMGEKLLPRVQ
jgi:integrase